MRTLVSTRGVCVLGVCLMIGFALAAPVAAEDVNGFQVEFRGEAHGSIEIGRIGFSDLVRTKADSLGEAELARLAGYLRDDLVRSLVNADWHGVAAQETVLTVTIVDVVPNRPTMRQIQELISAHYSTHASGGAALTAELRDFDGSLIAEYSFSWFNPDSGDGDGYGVWTDTRLAFSRFSSALADSLGVAPMPHS